MHFITKGALNRIAVVLLLAVFVIVGGIVAATGLKSELLPNIDIPSITVFTVYPGASPDDVLRDVTTPIERAVAGTENLKSTNSTSNDSVSFVTLSYQYGTNMEKAQQKVQEIVNRLTLPSQLPQKPTVGRFNFSDIPLVAYTINTTDTGPDALSTLRRQVSEGVLPELQGVAGVNSASISGGADKRILITLDEKKLAEKGLTAAQVQGVLQANNVNFPVGTIVNAGQSVPVVVNHEFTSVDDLRKIVVGMQLPAGAAAPGGTGAPGGYGPPGGSGAPGGTGAPGAPAPGGPPNGAAPADRSNTAGRVGLAAPGAAPTATGGKKTPTATRQKSSPTVTPSLPTGTTTDGSNQPSAPIGVVTGTLPTGVGANPATNPAAGAPITTTLGTGAPGAGTTGTTGDPGAPGTGTTGAPGAGAPGAAPVASPAPPKPVALQDVATVELINVAASSIARTNGRPSLGLVIYKTQNANTVSTAHAIEAKLTDLQAKLPGTQVVQVFGQASYIEDSLNSLIREGVSGAVLAILVILLFLRSVRSTLVTAVSIPMSVLFAFILLNIFGISLNIMSLAGLAVAVGRVVDDSIVVLENIYRHVHEGESPRVAAYNGTREVASAITSSTLTTVSVFLPLGFLAGLISEIFRPFAIAVTLALLASLLAALTIVPVLAALFIRPERRKAGTAAPAPGAAQDTLVQRIYTPALTLALRNRWTKLGTLALAFLLFVGSLVPLAAGAIGTTFLNLGSDKVISASLSLPAGTDVQTTSAVAKLIEDQLSKDPAVKNYQTTIGTNTDASASAFTGLGSDNTAALTINLNPTADLDAEANKVRTLLKANSQIKEVSVTTGSTTGGPSSSAFALTVTGPNAADLRAVSEKLATQLKTVPDLVNVKTDLQAQKPQISIKVDPDKALMHGSSAIQIAGQVRGLLTNQKVTNITIDSTPYDVLVGYNPSGFNSLDAIKAIKVGAVNPVVLSAIADVSEGQGPVSISRVNQEGAVNVSGTITSQSISGVQAAATKIVNDIKATAPAGIKISTGGSSAQFTEAIGQLGTALVIAIGLVYVVMVLFFGSLSTPFVIMFALPLAFIGSFLALWITGKPFGISAMIGLLMLVGIVVTNAIVLLDMVEQHKRLGYNTYDSLLHGGRVRVRPILMTAIATIIALIPLAISNEGSLIAAELGTVVIGGLFTSTLLTLLVVPVVYSILDSIRHRLTRRNSDDEEGTRLPATATPATNEAGAPAEPALVGARSQTTT